MKDRLSREEILHVAELARIELTEEEIEKYRVHIKKLLDDVEKIKDVQGYDDEQLIAPWSENSHLREDNSQEMYDPKEVIARAPQHSGNYVQVPVVIGESEGA